MPEKKTLKRARRDLRQGKSASTAAGEFVREEIHHVREGKHGARSAKQAIAIGLSKARRAGVPLKPPKPGQASAEVRHHAEQAYEAGQDKAHAKKPSARRGKAVLEKLKHESHRSASHDALARQARASARKRGPKARSEAARRAARTRRRG